MNAQIIILITILLTVFVILLGYATWRMRHRQPYLSVKDNPMMSPYSDEQKQHMRQLRARNRDALREVAGTDAVYGIVRPAERDATASDERAGPSRSEGGHLSVGGSAKGKGKMKEVRPGSGLRYALARWSGRDEGREEAGTWV